MFYSFLFVTRSLAWLQSPVKLKHYPTRTSVILPLPPFVSLPTIPDIILRWELNRILSEVKFGCQGNKLKGRNPYLSEPLLSSFRYARLSRGSYAPPSNKAFLPTSTTGIPQPSIPPFSPPLLHSLPIICSLSYRLHSFFLFHYLFPSPPQSPLLFHPILYPFAATISSSHLYHFFPFPHVPSLPRRL